MYKYAVAKIRQKALSRENNRLDIITNIQQIFKLLFNFENLLEDVNNFMEW